MPVTSKTALVIDALPAIGGAEKVLMAVTELFPDAPIFTLLYNRAAFAGSPLAGRKIYTSLIEYLPLARTYYRYYLPLMPLAIRQFDLSAYDLILSFSYAVAHGVKVLPGQQHFSYTFTPMRYAWRNFQLQGKPTSQPGIGRLLQLFRRWDARVVANIEHNAAVSHWIANWIERVYQKQASVIYPPVDVERFISARHRNDYFITISRLVPHKRLDLIVDAFNRLHSPLLIVGEGPERKHLESQARENIHFLGYQPDDVINALLSQARAYICACEEDFGIAMVEAQAAGCPVIAYGKGGALETVLEDQTGIFFDELSAESLEQAVKRFPSLRLASSDCINNAVRFNKLRFQSELVAFVKGA